MKNKAIWLAIIIQQLFVCDKFVAKKKTFIVVCISPPFLSLYINLKLQHIFNKKNLHELWSSIIKQFLW